MYCEELCFFFFFEACRQCFFVVMSQLFTLIVMSLCSESCDLLLDVVSSTFKMLYISHDLNIMAVPTPSNHVLLINIPDYFQVHMSVWICLCASKF